MLVSSGGKRVGTDNEDLVDELVGAVAAFVSVCTRRKRRWKLLFTWKGHR